MSRDFFIPRISYNKQKNTSYLLQNVRDQFVKLVIKRPVLHIKACFRLMDCVMFQTYACKYSEHYSMILNFELAPANHVIILFSEFRKTVGPQERGGI